jgi:hypothetical protein
VTVDFAEGMGEGAEERALLSEGKGGETTLTRNLQTSSGGKKVSIHRAW